MKVNIKNYPNHYDISKRFDDYIYKKYKRYPHRALKKMNFVETTVYKVIEMVQDTIINRYNRYLRSKNRVHVKIDRWDLFSLDHTLSLIILPALQKFKEDDRVSFQVDDEDVPDNIKSTNSKPYDSSIGELDDFYFDRSKYIMDAMIYSFEKIVDDSWEHDFYSYPNDVRPEFKFIAVDYDGNEVDEDEYEGEVMYKMDMNNRMNIDRDGINAINDKIDFGLKMFGKYYRGLWV